MEDWSNIYVPDFTENNYHIAYEFLLQRDLLTEFHVCVTVHH